MVKEILYTSIHILSYTVGAYGLQIILQIFFEEDSIVHKYAIQISTIVFSLWMFIVAIRGDFIHV